MSKAKDPVPLLTKGETFETISRMSNEKPVQLFENEAFIPERPRAFTNIQEVVAFQNLMAQRLPTIRNLKSAFDKQTFSTKLIIKTSSTLLDKKRKI